MSIQLSDVFTKSCWGLRERRQLGTTVDAVLVAWLLRRGGFVYPGRLSAGSKKWHETLSAFSHIENTLLVQLGQINSNLTLQLFYHLWSQNTQIQEEPLDFVQHILEIEVFLEGAYLCRLKLYLTILKKLKSAHLSAPELNGFLPWVILDKTS